MNQAIHLIIYLSVIFGSIIAKGTDLTITKEYATSNRPDDKIRKPTVEELLNLIKPHCLTISQFENQDAHACFGITADRIVYLYGISKINPDGFWSTWDAAWLDDHKKSLKNTEALDLMHPQKAPKLIVKYLSKKDLPTTETEGFGCLAYTLSAKPEKAKFLRLQLIMNRKTNDSLARTETYTLIMNVDDKFLNNK